MSRFPIIASWGLWIALNCLPIGQGHAQQLFSDQTDLTTSAIDRIYVKALQHLSASQNEQGYWAERPYGCLLYTSPSPRDKRQSRMPSSA